MKAFFYTNNINSSVSLLTCLFDYGCIEILLMCPAKSKDNKTIS